MTKSKTMANKPIECSEGVAAAKRFTSLVRRVVKTPKSEVDRRAKAWKEAREAERAATE
jgi:hypothetical protein